MVYAAEFGTHDCEKCTYALSEYRHRGCARWIPLLHTSAWSTSSNSAVFMVFFSLSDEHKSHTHTHNHFTALWILSGTTRLSWYQKKHSATDTYHGRQSSLICFIHLLLSMASSLLSPCAWQSFSTIFLQVFFGLPLGLAPSTSYSIHFFTQSVVFFLQHMPIPCLALPYRAGSHVVSHNAEAT